MTCVKMGVGVNYGRGHVYPGDLYQCPECDVKIVWTIGTATHDGDYSKFVQYFNEKKAPIVTGKVTTQRKIRI